MSDRSSGWSDYNPDGSPVAHTSNNAYLQEQYTLQFYAWTEWKGGFQDNSSNSLNKNPTKPDPKDITIPAQVFEDDTLTRKVQRGAKYESPRFEKYCDYFYEFMTHMYNRARTAHAATTPPEFVELRVFRSHKIYKNFDLPNQLFFRLGTDSSNDFVFTIGVKVSGGDITIVKMFKVVSGTITPVLPPGVEIDEYNLKMHAMVSVILTTPNKKRTRGAASINVPVSKCYYNCEAVWKAQGTAPTRERQVVTGYLQVLRQRVIDSMVVRDMADSGVSPPIDD